MNAAGPALRDIHVPPAAWWPPAPGWWIVLAVVVLVAVIALLALARHRRRAGLRAALREIDAIAAAYARAPDAVQLVESASRLLRRVALCIDPAAATAPGPEWVAFVHRYARTGATRIALDGLLDTRYRARPELAATELTGTLRAWCGDALAGGVHVSAVPDVLPRPTREAASS